MKKPVYYLFGVIVIVLVARTANYASLVPQYIDSPRSNSWGIPFNLSFRETFNDINDFSYSITSRNISSSLEFVPRYLNEINNIPSSRKNDTMLTSEDVEEESGNLKKIEKLRWKDDSKGGNEDVLDEDTLEVWRTNNFYACFNSGESYGAAWFATRASIFQRKVSTGHREHMETAGSLGLAANTPLKTVDVLDFSVEHLSWLDRRLGLRDMKGEMKELLLAELLEHMRLREVKTRTAALAKITDLGGFQKRKLLADGDIQTSPHVPNKQILQELPWYQSTQNDLSVEKRPLHVLAVFPYFATHAHCGETGSATKTDGKNFARCDSGSSDPLMRRYFLNLTFWATHLSVTTDIALSVCSDDDEHFARYGSGLPFFDVFRSNCRVFHPEFQKVVFKPGLLGVLTIMRLQDRFLKDPRFDKFTHVFYNEADQVIHTRLSASTLAFATLPRSEITLSSSSKKKWPFPYIVPHRLQPISDPLDLPSLSRLPKGGGGVPRWVHEDIARVSRAKRVHFPASRPLTSSSQDQGSCCVDRGECKTRNHWLKFKVPPEELDLAVMKIGDSLTMIAGEGDFGNLLFRNCTPSIRHIKVCPNSKPNST